MESGSWEELPLFLIKMERASLWRDTSLDPFSLKDLIEFLDKSSQGIGVPRWNRDPTALSPAVDRQRTAKRLVWFTWNRLTVNWHWRLIGLLCPFFQSV